jgi:hypothetical protein
MDIGIVTVRQEDYNKDIQDFTYGIGNNPPIVTGLTKLVQLVVVTLMTDADSDKFDGYGVGLMRILGSNINAGNITEVKSAITHMVIDTERQLLAEQNSGSYPLTERLDRIDLLDIKINDKQELEIEIAVINENNESAFIRL